jgi:activating signal cointegrator 1
MNFDDSKRLKTHVPPSRLPAPMQQELGMSGAVIPVQAISLWEPWASAMALGLKANETRGWFTAYRGDLVICSAKRPMTGAELELCHRLRLEPTLIVYGSALCIVELFDCVSTNGLGGKIPAQEAQWGNYDFGRFAWLTRNVRRLTPPIPVHGRQGFFTVELPATIIQPNP